MAFKIWALADESELITHRLDVLYAHNFNTKGASVSLPLALTLVC
jgi:hypothetical protein